MKIAASWVVPALPLLFLVGCAAPDSVSLDPGLEAAQLKLAPLDCPIDFDGISDKVDQRRVQGYWQGGTELENLSVYVNESIGSWLPIGTADASPARLQLALHQLHAQSKATATYFNVVFRMSVADSPAEYVRGRYSSMTWFGTPEEFQIKMQRAINEALAGVYRSLKEHCEDAAN